MDEDDFGNFEIGVIGGRGRMGRWLTGFLERSGFRVRAADKDDPVMETWRAARCRVVILAVPVSEVAVVMRLVGPDTRADGVIMDVCSLKAGPLEAMLDHARGEVIGLHPLFGPHAASLTGQTVFMCRGRGGFWPGRIEAWLRRQGANVAETSARRHDRLMAVVQTLRHLTLAALGGTMSQLGFDLEQDLPLAGPWFNGLVDTLAAQCAQPPGLFADLALSNPEAIETAEVFKSRFESLTASLQSGDHTSLMTAFQETWDYVAPAQTPGDVLDQGPANDFVRRPGQFDQYRL